MITTPTRYGPPWLASADPSADSSGGGLIFVLLGLMSRRSASCP
jgi:hypothetical protein